MARHDLAEANRLLAAAKSMLGCQAYNVLHEDHVPIGELIDEHFANDLEKVWTAVYDPSPKRQMIRAEIARVNNDLAEDWTWD